MHFSLRWIWYQHFYSTLLISLGVVGTYSTGAKIQFSFLLPNFICKVNLLFYILILLFLISSIFLLFNFSCVWYMHAFMCMDACEVDAGNHIWSLFHHIHWVKVFESSTVLKHMACLTSQLVLKNLHFYLPRLELYADHSTHPTLCGFLGIQTLVSKPLVLICILSQWWFIFTWHISIFKNCQRNT